MQSKMRLFFIKELEYKDSSRLKKCRYSTWMFLYDSIRKNLKAVGRNLNLLKCFHTQHFRNCCSTALKLLPDTHHGCVLIPGIYNRSLVFSNPLFLPPFLTRKWTDKTLAGALFQYKTCSDFFPGKQHCFHSYQLRMSLGKLFSQYITLTMPISVFFCLFSSFLKFLFFSLSSWPSLFFAYLPPPISYEYKKPIFLGIEPHHPHCPLAKKHLILFLHGQEYFL